MIASMLFIVTIWSLSLMVFFLYRARHAPVMQLIQMCVFSRICSMLKRPSGCHVVKKRDHYLVVYSIGESVYKLYIAQEVTHNPILLVSTQDGVNVTKTVVQYMGPRMDFGGVKMTPRMMGLDTLEVTYKNFEDRLFDVDDVIDIGINVIELI
jgi:hypothetical protein